MASQLEILTICLRDAADSAKPALDRSITHVVSFLQSAEAASPKIAERDELNHAWRMLLDYKVSWCNRYPQDLKTAFDESVATAKQTALSDLAKASSNAKPSAPNPYEAPTASRMGSLDSFSLVDDADVRQSIESKRLLQQILPGLEQSLAELNTLMSSALGLPNVRPELNPMRPEVFTNTLQTLIGKVDVDPAILSMWIKHLSEPMGKELKDIYKKTTEQLTKAHVPAATYRLLQTPAGFTGRGGGGGGGADAKGAAKPEAEVPGGQQPQGFGGGGGGGGGRGMGMGGYPGGRPGGQGMGEPMGQGMGQGMGQPVQYADLSSYEIRDELFQDFLFRGGANASHRLAPSYYAEIDQELAELEGQLDSGSGDLGGSGGDYYEPTLYRGGGPTGYRDTLSPDEAERTRYDDDGDGPGQVSFHRRAQRYRTIAVVDRPQRMVDVSSPLSPKVWGNYGRSRERALVRTRLRREATEVGQVLGLEVVKKLVNQVAQDPRLLVPVREAIVALEPSLLRMTMTDPRFFSDEGHPGRKIMERVAQRSFKYNDEYSAEFIAFFEPIAKSFNDLNGIEKFEDARPFGLALATLEYSWDTQDQEELAAKTKVMQALRFAEERQSMADSIAFELSSRSDLQNVPGVVLDFLFGKWALVLAHAKLVDTRNQIDPFGFRSAVPDLLWSVKRDFTLKNPAKLIEMIPNLLLKLHEGLDLLGQERRENEDFFESLMVLHRPVLKLRRLKSQKEAEESAAMGLDSAPAELSDSASGELGESQGAQLTPAERLAKLGEQPWLGRSDLDAAGFEDTQATFFDDIEAGADLSDEQGGDAEDSSQAPLPGTPLDEEELPRLDVTEAGSLGDLGDSTASAQLTAQPEGAKPRRSSQSGRSGRSSKRPTDDPVNLPELAHETAEALLLGLKIGSWVDLFSKRQWLRAQLVWAASKGTLFMFLSHGGQPHSMTKRSCEKLIAQHLLRPVETYGVVAQALKALAAEAQANANTQAATLQGTLQATLQDELPSSAHATL